MRPPVARGRGVQSWQGWAALAFAIGLVVSILLPGQAGLYLVALLFLSFLCIKGFLAGAWLRRARTRTQVAAAGAAEDARGATEVKTAEEAPRAAEVKAAEDTPSGAEAKAAEEAPRAAEVKGRTPRPQKRTSPRAPAAPQKRRPPRRHAAPQK